MKNLKVYLDKTEWINIEYNPKTGTYKTYGNTKFNSKHSYESKEQSKEDTEKTWEKFKQEEARTPDIKELIQFLQEKL